MPVAEYDSKEAQPVIGSRTLQIPHEETKIQSTEQVEKLLVAEDVVQKKMTDEEVASWR